MIFKNLLKRRTLRTFIINPRFQLDLIIRILILGFINFAFYYGAFRYHFNSFYSAGAELHMEPNSYYYRFLDQQLAGFNSTFLVISVISFVITFFGGVILSHRVAGPLYRLYQHLDRSGKGKSKQPLKFRKRDYFQEFASPLASKAPSKSKKAS